ncbi:protein of unknown function [Streptococcus thermophilus]|nr:protein of unknown function [Streptococcus thermophilus]
MDNLRQNIKLNLPQIVRPGLKKICFDKIQKPLKSAFSRVCNINYFI